MVRKIMVFVLVAFFAAGTLSAIAGDGSACKDKNVLQCMYNWFSGCDKPSTKTAVNNCRACEKACCKTCQTDCGGKCCADCGKK